VIILMCQIAFSRAGGEGVGIDQRGPLGSESPRWLDAKRISSRLLLYLPFLLHILFLSLSLSLSFFSLSFFLPHLFSPIFCYL